MHARSMSSAREVISYINVDVDVDVDVKGKVKVKIKVEVKVHLPASCACKNRGAPLADETYTPPTSAARDSGVPTKWRW